METEYFCGEGMSVDEAYILGVYNDSLSYLSLLSYGAATPASEHPLPLSAGPQNLLSNYQILQQHRLCAETEEKWKKLKKESSVKSASENARKRRQLIGEKTRCLQKLLPWNTKMDTATMLGEAANYVKFLQAQICVLNSMPLHTPTSTSSYSSASSFSKEVGMDSLNREELLAVMLNSPEIQTVLSRNGWCLYAVQQMPALLDDTEYLLHEMLWNYYYKFYSSYLTQSEDSIRQS